MKYPNRNSLNRDCHNEQETAQRSTADYHVFAARHCHVICIHMDFQTRTLYVLCTFTERYFILFVLFSISVYLILHEINRVVEFFVSSGDDFFLFHRRSRASKLQTQNAVCR